MKKTVEHDPKIVEAVTEQRKEALLARFKTIAGKAKQVGTNISLAAGFFLQDFPRDSKVARAIDKVEEFADRAKSLGDKAILKAADLKEGVEATRDRLFIAASFLFPSEGKKRKDKEKD